MRLGNHTNFCTLEKMTFSFIDMHSITKNMHKYAHIHTEKQKKI